MLNWLAEPKLEGRRLVLAAGFAPALATFSTSCLCIGLREQSGWSLQPVMLRQEFFTKEIRRLLHGGIEWLAEPKPAKRKNNARLRTVCFDAAAFATPASRAKAGRSLQCCPGHSGLMKPT